MAGSRKPGPLGLNPQVHDLNEGTTIRGLSPRPGPIGGPPVSIANLQGKPSVASLTTRARRKKASQAGIPVLRLGSRGPEVQKLQRQLNARLTGPLQLAVDGTFGPLTHQAVLQYQQGVSIAVDGIVGKQTWYRLLAGDKASVLASVLRTQPVVSGPGAAPQSPTVVPPPKIVPLPTAAVGIWEWPLADKFAEALRRTGSKLPGSMRHEFEALLSPTSLGIMVGTLVVWAGSHAFGVGEVVDVVLLVGGAFFLGMAVFDVAGELGDFLVVTSTAVDERDLDEAASHLARAIAIMGVAAFIALLAKVARGKGGKGGAAKTPAEPVRAEVQPSRKVVRPEPRSVEPPTPKQRVLNKTATELGNSRYGGVKAVRVRPGANDKVAVIGRSMDETVGPYTNGLQEEGYNVETFSGDKISPGAQAEWKMLKKKYAPEQIPEDVVRDSQMFQENQAWAKKLKDQGYTVVDVGNPGAQKSSPFYETEKEILFGDGSVEGER